MLDIIDVDGAWKYLLQYYFDFYVGLKIKITT